MIAALTLCALAACGPATTPTGVNDPYETANRRTHEFNRGLDRALVRPAAEGYSLAVPDPVQDGVSNFADNLDLPGDVLNNLLQLRLGDAVKNSFRLAVNSTFGLGGLLDPATEMGLAHEETDFGETLHVWGAPEGAYVELPLAGPSTERDAFGLVTDIALNPTRWLVPSGDRKWVTGANIGGALSARSRYGDLIDSILYESADSYAQARVLYLQNRRFELGGRAADPYAALSPDQEDSYADPDYDPIADPNYDPFAQ